MAEVASIQQPYLESNLVYTVRDEKHQVEKPYKLQYDAGPDSEIPRTNTNSKHYGPIPVNDFRNLENPMTFERNGFSVLDMPSELQPEDFYNTEKVRETYYPALQAVLREEFKATRVEILEHLVCATIHLAS
jgi:hypothetical protein